MVDLQYHHGNWLHIFVKKIFRTKVIINWDRWATQMVGVKLLNSVKCIWYMIIFHVISPFYFSKFMISLLVVSFVFYIYIYILTHLPLDKMAAIWASDIFICIFSNDRIPIQISPKLVPISPLDNKPVLIQVMAWCWNGDNPIHRCVLLYLYGYDLWQDNSGNDCFATFIKLKLNITIE